MGIYDDLPDAELLRRAQNALLRAQKLGVSSTYKATHLAVFDSLMSALAYRAMGQILAGIRKAEEDGEVSDPE